MEYSEIFEDLRKAYKVVKQACQLPPLSLQPKALKTIEHTDRVVLNILILCDNLELNEDEKAIAEIVALFHDMGRIKVLTDQDTSSEPTNHAELSVEFLKKNESFNLLSDKIQTIITETILSHNKPELSQKEGDLVLFYLKLLRDADKLDVWYSTSEYVKHKTGKPNLALDLALSEKPFVTASFCQTIIDGEIPNKKDLITFNDFIIFQMALVFDLNFKKSFQILNQKQYIRHLYDSLPKNDSVIEIYRMIRIYTENRI